MAVSLKKTTLGRYRYYERDSIVPFEEDHYHEFKGHRNLCFEELKSFTTRNDTSRKAASRNINGFLNTGDGGTVYLGILDDGRVKGFQLTQLQKDHVLASLDDLMNRYSPPVAAHRYKIQFIPVLNKDLPQETKLQQCAYEYSVLEGADIEARRRPHHLRTRILCWCDKDAAAEKSMGMISSTYVLEIYVKPWDPSDYRNLEGAVTDANIHPIHEDEQGNAYFRRQASLVTYTMSEMAQMTRKEVKAFYEPEINKLKNEIEKCLHTLKKKQDVL